jgi:hypothetical protein
MLLAIDCAIVVIVEIVAIVAIVAIGQSGQNSEAFTCDSVLLLYAGNHVFSSALSLLPSSLPVIVLYIRRFHPSIFHPSISSKIPLRFQCFKHSPVSIALAPNCALSHEIVRRAPENTRSGSSLIAGIERMSIAIEDNLGQRFLCWSSHHQLKGDSVSYSSPEI